MEKMDRARLAGCVGVVAWRGLGVAMARTGLTMDGAVATLNSVFMLGVFLLGAAALCGIAYEIVRRQYGMTFDGAISIISTCALGGSAALILALVGVTPAATLE